MAYRKTKSVFIAAARQAAKYQRQKEAAERRLARETTRLRREAERAQVLQAKEAKEQYLASRLNEVAEQNTQLEEYLHDLQSILESTLEIDDTITFDSLRIREQFTPSPVPKELREARPAPQVQSFLGKVKAPSLVERALGMQARYQQDQKAAQEQYQAALKTHEASETERKMRLEYFIAEQDTARKAYDLKVQQRDMEVSELEEAYRDGDISAVVTYNSMVLERSEYPDQFPQEFRIAYLPESKELVVDYELPGVDVVPAVEEFKYVKARDNIDEKARKASEIKEIYQDIVASVALRTLHEIFEADQGGHCDVVVFSGFVHSVDPATGKDTRPCVISVRTTRERFSEINLARVDKRACLRSLGAQVSPQPQALQPVKPVVDFDMVDRRFIDQGDTLSQLESRPNLMDLSPSDFEDLVSNLFSRMGLETRLTRASRDGGVDVVAFDTRPVLGGKVVIQAKRYKNTVGVSAVRDLYGTMLNEGASKGIIVTTSSYGPDAYEFSKDKPLELIDGGGLLYLLDQVGVQAQIIILPNS